MQDFNEQPLLSAKVVDRYSKYLESPVERLKFLDALRKIQSGDTGFLRRMTLWLPVLGSLRRRALVAIEVAKLMPPGRKVPLNFRILFVLYRLRLALYAGCLIGISRSSNRVKSATLNCFCICPICRSPSSIIRKAA